MKILYHKIYHKMMIKNIIFEFKGIKLISSSLSPK
jgi:hypothetical protein